MAMQLICKCGKEFEVSRVDMVKGPAVYRLCPACRAAAAEEEQETPPAAA